MRVPIDQAFAPVDQAFVIHFNEHLDHGIMEIPRLAFRRAGRAGHRKGCAIPIAAGTKAFQLIDDCTARLRFPIPNFVQKCGAAHFRPAWQFRRRQLPLNHHLRCDPRMIRAGLPKRIKPPHAVPADQDILQSVVERMPHVQRARNIGGRDHNAECFGAFRIRTGLKTARFFPSLVKPAFCFLRIEVFVQSHQSCPVLHYFAPR